MKLNNKIAVVTGGAGGLGIEICRELARQGAHVAILDRPDVIDAASQLNVSGSTAIQLAVDITENAAVEAAFSEIENRLGSIDILVNAAGITGTSRPTHEATEKDFDDVFAVNVKGTFFCSKYAIQSMKRHKTGGAIVNISSTYGVAANADIPLYHATKAAVIMMAKPIVTENWTSAGVIAFGRTWTSAIQASRRPSARAASTKPRCFWVSTSARVRRT